MMRRALLALLALVVLAGACGGGQTTLREYVDEVDAIFVQGLARYQGLLATPRGAVLIAQGEELLEFTTADLQWALEELAEIQNEAIATSEAIDPPSEVEDLHELFFRRLPIEALAARAGASADWYELSSSNEMIAYRAALGADELVCMELQDRLDATAQRGVFAENPWLPAELDEIVDYALGCGSLVENPDDIYRPPPRG